LLYITNVRYFLGSDYMIENSVINEIRNNVDIVEVISGYLPLTAKGKNYFGVCPFHDDHSPSMSVSKEKQIYTCFSCGATGNVFRFLQDYENIGFTEAVKKCADIAGIPLDINTRKNDLTTKYSELYDIYSISQKFYQNNMNSSIAKEAKEYLYSRSLTDEEIKEFEIGLSLKDTGLLTKLLKNKKYSDKSLLQSGLVGESENGIDLYDLYRDRIMFPIHDISGKLIAYNGRAYHGETTNKYVNSKETDIFKKRDILYNYHRAKDASRIKKEIIIMEGPMDVIRAYRIGVKNVVATLGTAFGSSQAMMIRKLSSNVILCFDGDEAGLKATKLAIEELVKIGIEPKVVRIEDNSDPDDYIKKYGKDSFIKIINNAMNLIEFKEYSFKINLDMDNAEDLASYANSMIKEIKNIEDEILKEISIKKLSEETKLDIDFIKSKVIDSNITKSDEIVIKKESKRLNKYEKSERNLVFYMLHHQNVIKMYDKKITYMPTSRYRHLAFQISSFFKKHEYINIADLLTELRADEDSIKTIGELESLSLKENYVVEEIDDYLENIRKYNEESQIRIYKKELSKSNDFTKKIEIANKLIEHKLRSEEND
jgi:DNA primase, catalytic core